MKLLKIKGELILEAKGNFRKDYNKSKDYDRKTCN